MDLGEGWAIEPTAGIGWTLLDQDSFDETGAGAVSLAVDDRTENSLRTHLSLGASKLFKLSESVTFLPEVSAGWAHEYLDDDRGLTARFIGQAPSFKVTGDDPSRDTLLIGGRLTLFLDDRLSIFTDFSSGIRSDGSVFGGALGARLRF